MRHKTADLLRKVMHESRSYMRSQLEQFGLYRGQPKMLYVLSKNDGLTKKELAERFDVAAPTITKMVERLEKKKFVYTKKDDKDRRITRVYICKHGKSVVKDLMDFNDQTTDMVFKGMSDDEVDTLHFLLSKVDENFSEANKENRPEQQKNCTLHHEGCSTECNTQETQSDVE